MYDTARQIMGFGFNPDFYEDKVVYEIMKLVNISGQI